MWVSPAKLITIAGSAIAMACCALMALMADKMTVLSPRAIPAHVARTTGLAWRQKVARDIRCHHDWASIS
jgi:hypothetical protein